MFIKRAIFCLVLTLALTLAGVVQAKNETGEEPEQFYAHAAKMRRDALVQNETCFSCHGKEDIRIKWKTERGRTLQLHVDPVDYRNSVHSGQNCQSCHQGEGEDAFSSAPHRFKNEKPGDCRSCHGSYFKEIDGQVARSYHTKAIVDKGRPFDCASCHDPHTFRPPERVGEIAGSVAKANDTCLKCHSDLRGYEALTDKKLLDQDMAHWFLPKKERHFSSVRCVDCHGSSKGTEFHAVMPAKETEVSCEYCHSKSSAMTTALNRYRSEQRAYSMVGQGMFDDKEFAAEHADAIKAATGRADSALGFMNARLLDNKYVTGITRTPWLNVKFFRSLVAVLLLIAFHTMLRFMGTKAVSAHGGGEMIFPLPVRVWHWLNAVLFLILIATGFAMHFTAGIPFETAQSTHGTLALAIAAFWGLYLVYLVLTGQIRQYLPRADFIPASFRQVAYYLSGIYRGRENPAGHDPARRLNPLQQMAYLGVLFILFPVLLASGAALLVPDVIPPVLMGMDGKRLVSLVHTGGACASVIFIVVHLYLCTTGESVFALVRSMVTGRLPGNRK